MNFMHFPTSRPGPELQYLHAFHAVCDSGGFTAAARRLGCTQPAVSYQIRRLEQTLGVQLLERGTRRLVLTREGKRLRDFAERMATELQGVRNALANSEVMEPLRLGSASGFGRYVLVPALLALRASRGEEGLEVRLQYEAADVLLDWLEGGEYEAAFVYKRRISNALSYQPVYQEELVMIADPQRAADWRARNDGDDLSAFDGTPFVTYEECEYVFGRWFETNFGTQPSRLISAAHFTELEEVVDFVAVGAGVSIVPRDAAMPACARKEIELVYAGGRTPCMNQVYMVHRSGSVVRPLLARLADIIKAN